MKTAMWKFVIAAPVYVTLRSMSAEDLDWLLSMCFGFTAYLLADIAVRVWDANDR